MNGGGGMLFIKMSRTDGQATAKMKVLPDGRAVGAGVRIEGSVKH